MFISVTLCSRNKKLHNPMYYRYCNTHCGTNFMFNNDKFVDGIIDSPFFLKYPRCSFHHY